MPYDLKGKVIIITGANSGIGKAACIQQAKLGATVVMACRSRERGLQALEKVRFAAMSTKVELMAVDMSSQNCIHQFVTEFKERYEYLHVLIHNAANFDHTQDEPVLTDDGLETVFATNHLGPFLMTRLLLNILKASAPSRVITVAGKYWDAPGVAIRANKNAYNKETQKRLWAVSELLTSSIEHDLD